MSQNRMGSVVRATESQYDVSTGVLGDRLTQLPAGSNVLLEGPSMIGKEQVALQIAATGQRSGQPVLLVSTESTADRLVTKYENAGGTDDGSLYIVDCSGSSGRGTFQETDRVKYVSSPGDLTGVGIGMAKCMRAIGEQATNGLRSSMISLSTLLEYASEKRVFDFTHVVGGRITAANFLGFWTLDTTSHDQKTVNTIRGQFDYVAEFRETESGDRESRILGGDPDWRTWEPLASR